MGIKQTQNKRAADILERVPYTVSGLVLAWAALGNFFLTPDLIAVRVICGAMSLACLAVMIAKIIVRPASILKAAKNPVVWGAFATVYMGLMVYSAYCVEFFPKAAFALWLCAVLLQFGHMVFYAVKHLKGSRLQSWYTSIFVTYVGIGVAAESAPLHHQEQLGSMLLVFSAICLIILMPIMLYRYLRYPVNEPALIATICIFTAPFSVVLTGYCRCAADPGMELMAVLTAFCLFFYVGVLAQTPRILLKTKKFVPTLACLTFPFTISARAMFWVAAVLEQQKMFACLHVFRMLYHIQLIIAVGLVLYTSLRFAWHMFK